MRRRYAAARWLSLIALTVVLTAGCGRLGLGDAQLVESRRDEPDADAGDGPDADAGDGPDADAGDGPDADAGDVSDAEVPDADTCTSVFANSISEFSTTQGQDGWWYGYYVTPFAHTDFVELTEVVDSVSDGTIWTPDGDAHWTFVGARTMHPNSTNTSGGRESVEHRAVRRWTSDVAGPVKISGVLGRPGSTVGDGILATIYRNGVELWSQRLLATDTEFGIALDTNVAVGDNVDFVVAPVASDGTDKTIFEVEIVCRD